LNRTQPSPLLYLSRAFSSLAPDKYAFATNKNDRAHTVRMGAIITFTGRSGSGKTSIVRALLAHPQFAYVPSNTSRPSRPTDFPGEYTSCTLEDFAREEDWLWVTPLVHGNRYGTKKSDVARAAENDRYNLMILTPHNLQTLRYSAHNTPLLHLFLEEAEEECKQRMLVRGDTPDSAEKRLAAELHWKDQMGVPYEVIANPNGALEQTAEHVRRRILDFPLRLYSP